MFTSARPRSYSYMPDSNTPLTLKRRVRGKIPLGVAVPKGVITTTESPTWASSARASALPRIIRYCPGARSSSRPAFRWPAKPVALRSSSGSTPRIEAPTVFTPCASNPCASTKGTAAWTPGCLRALRWTAGQSVSVSSRPVNVAWEVTLRMRVRSSLSNPFMTERTTSSVATPSISPSTDISATNETNPRRCVERR